MPKLFDSDCWLSEGSTEDIEERKKYFSKAEMTEGDSAIFHNPCYFCLSKNCNQRTMDKNDEYLIKPITEKD